MDPDTSCGAVRAKVRLIFTSWHEEIHSRPDVGQRWRKINELAQRIESLTSGGFPCVPRITSALMTWSNSWAK